ncbi:MAG: tocopherol cyclase family protein [Candidatus Humimicrobiaceae bacterium]
MYKGTGRRSNYFEGWYFKLVDQDAKNIYAVIPGVSINKNDPHAFIQVLDGSTGKSDNIRFDIDDFSYSKHDFKIWIGDNFFSENRLNVNLSKNNFNLSGNLKFSEIKNWPKTLISPGIMGWYSFLPFMECYHGVISLDHSIEGELLIGDKKISYNGGKGYIEKDWGTSFPEAWIWMQSNHFGIKDTSFMLSIAKIPWLRSYFTGLIAGFLVKDKLYRFATYTGASVKELELKDSDLSITIEDSKNYLKIDTIASITGKLLSPKSGKMEGRINESINSEIRVSLSSKNGSMIFEGTGRAAGLEVTNVSRLG